VGFRGSKVGRESFAEREAARNSENLENEIGCKTACETSKIVDLQQHAGLKGQYRALNCLFTINKSREIAQGSRVRADSDTRERDR
jgi:hypothetical protein